MLCSTLAVEKFPSDLKVIEDYAFYGCAKAAFGADYCLDLPEGLESIGRSAFYQTSLMGLTIPSSCKTIGDYAFYGSAALGGNVNLLVGREEDGTPIIATERFYLTIREGVEHIGDLRISTQAEQELH